MILRSNILTLIGTILFSLFLYPDLEILEKEYIESNLSEIIDHTSEKAGKRKTKTVVTCQPCRYLAHPDDVHCTQVLNYQECICEYYGDNWTCGPACTGTGSSTIQGESPQR